MATASNAEPASDADFGPDAESDPDAESGPDAESVSESDPDAESESSSPSIADRLRTVGTVVWATFLASVVVFTLIPAVALWFGAVPFDPPPTTPYFALVGFALAGTAVLILAAIYDV